MTGQEADPHLKCQGVFTDTYKGFLSDGSCLSLMNSQEPRTGIPQATWGKTPNLPIPVGTRAGVHSTTQQHQNTSL